MEDAEFKRYPAPCPPDYGHIEETDEQRRAIRPIGRQDRLATEAQVETFKRLAGRTLKPSRLYKALGRVWKIESDLD